MKSFPCFVSTVGMACEKATIENKTVLPNWNQSFVV